MSAALASASMNARAWRLLILLSLLFGSAFFFAKIAVSETPPLTVVLVRVALAAIVLLAINRMAGNRLPREARVWLDFAVLALANNVIPFGLLFWAQTEIPSSLAAILNATTPLFAALVAVLFLGERLGFAKWLGLALGIAGVAIMLAPQIGGWGEYSIVAQLACIAAAACYGVGVQYVRRVIALPSLTIAAAQLVMSTIILLPIVFLFENPWQQELPSPRAIGAILCLALFSTAAAYTVAFRLVAEAGGTNTSLVTVLIPMVATSLGVLILDERLSLAEMLGMAVIVFALLIADNRLRLPRRTPQPLA